MLTLTDEATEVIQGLVGSRPGAGLRIFSEPSMSSNGDQAQFGLAISDGPEPTDEVVEQSGAYVFLDQQIAPLVDGSTLDARPMEGEREQFAFLA